MAPRSSTGPHSSTKRSYADGCAAAHALDLVGERWALLVVRELVLGPKRFTDLRAGLPGISPNVLTQRLNELEQAGVLRRRKLPPPAAAWVYELSDWGQGLGPILIDLGRWGARSPALPQGAPLSIDALVLSFRAMFDAKAAAGLKASYELRLGEDRFHVLVEEGRMALGRGSPARADAVFEADPNRLAAVVYGGRKLPEALRLGEVRVEGDKAAARRFASLFPLPAPAALPDAGARA
ncbi:winged helix-turn-helix transcriptional regulator [Aquabacterium sp. A7-Y]|uniref:winged helix-turn-helix transcriptional regulator n=1 Tax=Aquabacterium sp. A7-Y TaxID=1349605 RepID=UPI00223CB168|nr:winged helix-turn-helix transcriptional regulator [Aquabacterium sp. A7-Y]MCW7538075.1 winged helix-turn-helix transcriptional regulator [Aquabacterium sp. A7-Y]